jgi:thiol-disulfide isomerase/thioredoxin
MVQEHNFSRRHFLVSGALTIGAVGLGMNASAETGSALKGELRSLVDAKTWLNSQPLTAAELEKKVVLVDFWTYSCINWRRQLPYVRAWHEKYKAHGLLVVGAHAPEFSFEKNVDNVRWAAKDMRIDYPIVIDNDHVIWRAFNNDYWPALFFVDAKGHVRHHAYGEGQYEESEVVIQRLLGEAGNRDVPGGVAAVDARGAEAAADWSELESGENYVGYGRTENFASPGGVKADKVHTYTRGQLRRNEWALSGNWTMNREAIVLNEPNGRITYRFRARDLHLVMGPAATNSRVRFRVLIDDQAPRAAHGVDIDDDGNGTVIESRMYQLIRQPGPISDRQFEIQFLDAGAEAYSFTFG